MSDANWLAQHRPEASTTQKAVPETAWMCPPERLHRHQPHRAKPGVGLPCAGCAPAQRRARRAHSGGSVPVQVRQIGSGVGVVGQESLQCLGRRAGGKRHRLGRRAGLPPVMFALSASMFRSPGGRDEPLLRRGIEYRRDRQLTRAPAVVSLELSTALAGRGLTRLIGAESAFVREERPTASMQQGPRYSKALGWTAVLRCG